MSESSLSRYKKYVPRFIRHDFMRKFIALLFSAMIVWLVNTKQTEDREIKNIRVTLTPMSDYIFRDPSAANEKPAITVTVRGIKDEIEKLSPSDFHVDVSVGAEAAASGIAQIRRAQISVSNKSVKVVAPEVIEIKVPELEKIVTEEIPVKVDYNPSELPAGYSVSRKNGIALFAPDGRHEIRTVKVRGPESIIRRISVSTKRIPLEDMTGAFEFTTPLVVNPAGNEVELIPSKLRVKVTVVQDTSEYKMTVPLTVLANPALVRTFRVVPSESEISITVSGTRENIEKFRIARPLVYAYIDISEIKKGEGSDVPRDLNVICFTDFPDVKLTPSPATLKVTVH